MNKALTNNWNAVVKPDDLVYHLGDFSFQSDRYREFLNGHIVLIRGNHDSRKHDYLFDSVVEQMDLKIGEFNCFLTHVPIVLDEVYGKGFKPDFSLLDKYDYIVHGHTHNKFKAKGKNVNLSVENWDYKPVHINELTRFLRSLKEAKNNAI